ncbi:MAG TPA: hypothetical protein VIV12_22390 [Streptosporangiaceae bacterium]
MELAPGDTPRQAEPATLRDLCNEFPQFAIWREVMPDRARFTAQRIGFEHGLHSVITADVAELRAILTQARAGKPPCPPLACLPGLDSRTSAAARTPSS